jgi:hypothetical protein
MEQMRRVAYETVLRACGFATLAIFCVMIGMAFDPRLAFQAGGFLTTVMAFVLILKSREALTKDYRKTEMWLYLDKDFRPPEAYAQWASSTILRDTYLTFALWTSAISIAMWVLALTFAVLGVKSTYALDNAQQNTPGQIAPVQAAPVPGTPETPPRVRNQAPAIRYQVYP